ncbi:papain-like cysteine protease family protein [Chondrinema litorale]|uniref:papain-like cysteine protease family protein n=1 Tax=Chondrinema litorale TaxID=2994555 RepID=UPI00254319DB|nr:papain-like cysteine protease family protein [Chondrinema litorale]UZS00227.1 hypothetical protein OQ292_40415 [Chondrinema litorale]
MHKTRRIIIIVFMILAVGIGGFTLYKIYFSTIPSLDQVLKESDFAEMKPPNNLAKPGTIVSIDENNPGILKIICTCEKAFGDNIENSFLVSRTTDIDLTTKLSNKLNLDLSVLKDARFKTEANVIRNMSLKLSNVEILELPDNAVFEYLNNRSASCIEAINNRLNSGNKVSLIKRVIKADAEYSVDFFEQIDASTQTQVVNNLGEILTGVSGKNGSIKSNKIIGEGLFWGVDDDVNLGNLQPGQSLGTGSIEEEEGILDSKKGYHIEYEQVKYDVSPVKQPSKNSCWITVYKMMLSWKMKEEVPIDSIASYFGNPWENYYLKDLKLPANKLKDFLSISGLSSMPPANYIQSEYSRLLEEYGPLWMIIAKDAKYPLAHAKLLIGIYGNHLGNDSILEFIDPADGKVQRQKFMDFLEDYEREVIFINEKIPGTPLKAQIIHWREKIYDPSI